MILPWDSCPLGKDLEEGAGLIDLLTQQAIPYGAHGFVGDRGKRCSAATRHGGK